jgi:hypothetical protein
MHEDCIESAGRNEAMALNLAPGIQQQDNEALHVPVEIGVLSRAGVTLERRPIKANSFVGRALVRSLNVARDGVASPFRCTESFCVWLR